MKTIAVFLVVFGVVQLIAASPMKMNDKMHEKEMHKTESGIERKSQQQTNMNDNKNKMADNKKTSELMVKSNGMIDHDGVEESQEQHSGEHSDGDGHKEGEMNHGKPRENADKNVKVGRKM